MPLLDREEYVEQAHFFRVLGERLRENTPIQEVFEHVQDEILTVTRLPQAIGFLLTELRHRGACGPAMKRLAHYFTPFQAYIFSEAEDERGRFDLRVAVEVLRAEAEYRSKQPTPAGLFVFQFETISRNRLRYDPGLAAAAEDPLFNDDWRTWILTVRRQVGLVDITDLIYVRSQYYRQQRGSDGLSELELATPVLFGEREGRIALANRGKDPQYLFASLQRHLAYPPVPRLAPVDPQRDLLPQMVRKLERLEARLKLLEDEQRGGIDLAKFAGEVRRETPHP